MANAGSKRRELLSERDFSRIFREMRGGGASFKEISVAMGYQGHQPVMSRAKRLGLYTSGFQVDMPPPENTPVDELLARKERMFERKKKHAEAAATIPVRVTVPGPVGILHFGDPHIDDDGCDIKTLKQHIEYVSSVDGLFGANVGDTTNNWVGRLAHLYSEQSTTAADAMNLLEWFVKEVDWLYLIGGNHDLWSGSRDPIAWIQKHRDALYTPSECRLKLSFPGTSQTIGINARHDFSGHSMWNPAHGVGRAMQMGDWYDISVCGHRHVSGYMPLVAPDGRVCHAIQCASYKQFDRYARDKGFRNQTIEPGVLTVLDPAAKTPAQVVTVFLSVDEGVEYLKWKRKKAA